MSDLRDSAHTRAAIGAHTLVTLLELTQRLSQDAPLEDLLHAVTDTALALLPCDHASIRIVDASGTELLSSARSGVGAAHRAVQMRKGVGIAGWVLAHGRPVHVPDVREDERFAPSADQGFSVQSMIAAPLLYDNRVIGIFSVSSPEAHAFTSDDELLARLLANSSVPAIDRARLARLAVTDDLTAAYNARYLDPRLVEEIERARRHGHPLSVAMLDLDHFKDTNDTWGHARGDIVLRTFADRVRDNTRRFDLLVRKGGEEFVLLLPETPATQAVALADRVRQAVGVLPMDIGDATFVVQTVSIGTATYDGAESPHNLLERADQALYEAKRLGRNRVVAAR
jgi:diguanylate cyclase (GGDEF)-like protein